jgi:hypothetical protein
MVDTTEIIKSWLDGPVRANLNDNTHLNLNPGLFFISDDYFAGCSKKAPDNNLKMAWVRPFSFTVGLGNDLRNTWLNFQTSNLFQMGETAS